MATPQRPTRHGRSSDDLTIPTARQRCRPGVRQGTVWTNHSLRTGFERFSIGKGGGYVAEKAETESGWIFPVGDEVSEFGYVDMLTDMFDALDRGVEPTETLNDGYVVNAIMDACYRSGTASGNRSRSSGAAASRQRSRSPRAPSQGRKSGLIRRN
jgi:hypothetical protein